MSDKDEKITPKDLEPGDWLALPFKTAEGRYDAELGTIALKLIDAAGRGVPVAMTPAEAAKVIGYVLTLARTAGGGRDIQTGTTVTVEGLHPTSFGYTRGASASETRFLFQVGPIGFGLSLPTSKWVDMCKSVAAKGGRPETWKSH